MTLQSTIHMVMVFAARMVLDPIPFHPVEELTLQEEASVLLKQPTSALVADQILHARMVYKTKERQVLIAVDRVQLVRLVLTEFRTKVRQALTAADRVPLVHPVAMAFRTEMKLG